jgi:DNA replication protein DnaC
MSEKISETLRKLAAATPKASSPTSSTTETPSTLGDPNCPECHGVGYLRRDLPLGHPDFGRLDVCACRLPEVRETVRRRLYSLSRLDELRGLTFETFSPRGRPNLPAFHQDSLQAAFHHAQTYAHSLEGWLLIQGGYGCGKTHLAAAIANECVSLGVPTLFLTVPDLLDSLRFSFDSEEVTFEERFEQLRSAPFLVLDDFGTQHATEWAREKLFQIMNHRYINRLPTVVTTNLELDEVEGRMRSRLADSALVLPVRIEAPDYRRATEDTGHHELSSLGLHAQQDFGAWSSRDGEGLPAEHQRNLKKAFETARKFAESPEGWLVLTGTYGCGKTHLAAAIANYRASQGFPVMFVPVPDLLDHLRATFSPASSVSYDRRFDEIRTTPLLVLDDLGTQATTPWAQEKLFQLLNHRYNAALPTVITSARSVDELAKSDPRLVSRMLDTRLCTIFAITAPSYLEGRVRRKKR